MTKQKTPKSTYSYEYLLKIILVVFAIGIILSSYTIDLKNSIDTKKVYHVYIDGEQVGIVKDKSLIKKVIKEKEEDFKIANPNIRGAVSNEITYVKEEIYESEATISNNSLLENKLASIITVEATVAGISVNNKVAMLLKDRNEAQMVLDRVKQFELGPNPPKVDNTTKLAVGQTVIRSIEFDKDVKIVDVTISDDKLVSVDEAVALITQGTLQREMYTVRKGETFSLIADNFGLKSSELKKLNPTVVPDMLKIGQKLNVTMLRPMFGVKLVKETNKIVNIAYTTKKISDKKLPKGEKRVTQKGRDGEKVVLAKVYEVNGKVVSKKIISQQIISKPRSKIVLIGTKVIPSRGTGQFAWPTNGGYISSFMKWRWGKFHKGIDIARPTNRTIKSVDNGVVTFAGWDSGGYGNKVVINHRNGFVTLYGHMSSIKVRKGQVVSRGQAIGVMGSTGESTGVHLHIEVYLNGKLCNPVKYLKR